MYSYYIRQGLVYRGGGVGGGGGGGGGGGATVI
jgi:hypothetical protein